MIDSVVQRHEDDGELISDIVLSDYDEQLQRRAREIILGDRAVDEILSPKPAEAEASVYGEPVSPNVQQAHAAQLIDYIRQTRTVAGPRQDLVNLESIGTSYGADRSSHATSKPLRSTTKPDGSSICFHALSQPSVQRVCSFSALLSNVHGGSTPPTRCGPCSPPPR